jgi:hypothetical protein
MNHQQDPDEPLVADLRDYFARVDPVPPLVTQAAKAALGWRRLDADLAELLADSTLEAESLATVRGAGAAVRSVSFGAGELTIDLEIHVDGTRRTLLGLLTPASIARIEIQTADGASTVATSESDALGRFRTQLSAGGNIRLRLVPVDLGSASPVETSWITL